MTIIKTLNMCIHIYLEFVYVHGEREGRKGAPFMVLLTQYQDFAEISVKIEFLT